MARREELRVGFRVPRTRACVVTSPHVGVAKQEQRVCVTRLERQEPLRVLQRRRLVASIQVRECGPIELRRDVGPALWAAWIIRVARASSPRSR